MKTLIAALALLAMQIDLTLSPALIMKRAAARSVSDAQTLREHYDFDVVSNSDKKSRCKNPADSHITIEDLFGYDRYQYEIEDPITLSLNDRPVYVITFSPKPDKQPGVSSEASMCLKVKNETLNHLKGRVYVDQEDFGIVRVVTHINDPPTSYYGVGRLYKMDVTFEQFRLGEIWAPKKVSVDAEFSYFLGWLHSREKPETRFENYRPKAP